MDTDLCPLQNAIQAAISQSPVNLLEAAISDRVQCRVAHIDAMGRCLMVIGSGLAHKTRYLAMQYGRLPISKPFNWYRICSVYVSVHPSF